MSTNHLNRDALIIGICQYDDLPMSAQLDTLAKQAEQFAQILETQGGFKVRQLPCTPDLKMSFNDRLAISDTIFSDGRLRQFGLEKAIEELFYPANPSPEHVALLFFAGHGLVKSTKAGTEGFLATSEADGKTVYGISLKWLRDLLRNSPIKQQVVFLESCHSGEFFTHFQTDEKRDYCFVTSARAHEAALAEGLLTKALLDILDYTHQPKDTPWVNSDTLIENLQQQLTTAEGWQRFEMQTQGHLMLTNYAFSQQVDPNAKPYKGLHYFDNKPEDALFFKGRDKLIAELLTKVKTKPFLAVLGASGNGKSSVVRAGVLYQLQQTGSCEIVNPFTPTATPLTALTNGLGTTEIVALVNASTKARVILTIDQFEEVFSLCQDSQARETFFNILLDAVEQATGKFCLIVVMRADFMDKCSQYPRLARYFQDHQHIVTRPTEAEIQQIIEAPAKQAGFLVEPRLVAEMVTDFKDSLGGLPLLEFALTTLWEKGKADRLLRYADYQALGGIQGILEKKATETYEELTPAEQVVAKRVFLELTELGEGRHDTRRLVPQTDLLGFATRTASPSRTGSPEPSVEQVIAKLVKEHLIVTDKTAVTVVNIAHDALIEHWSVLRNWLDQSRDDLKLQRQINEGAKAWKEGKKALLVGVDLARAEEYLGTHLERVPLLEVGVEFVKASVALRELEARERERLQRRNLLVLAVSFVVAVVLGLFGWWQWGEASKQRDHAQQQEQVATAQKVVAQQQRDNALRGQSLFMADLARQQLEKSNSATAMRLALEALPGTSSDNPQRPFVSEVQDQLYAAIEQHWRGVWEHDGQVNYVEFSPDGKKVLTATGNFDEPFGNNAYLWEFPSGKLLKVFRGHTQAVQSAHFTPDAKRVLTVSYDGTARLWDIESAQQLRVFRNKILAITEPEPISIFDPTIAAVSPNGKLLAMTIPELDRRHKNENDWGVWEDDKRVERKKRYEVNLWDVETGQEVAILRGEVAISWIAGDRGDATKIFTIRFSPDGKQLVIALADNTVRVLDIESGREVAVLKHEGKWDNTSYTIGVIHAIFSPDGKQVLSIGRDHTIRLWDIKTSKQLTILHGPSEGTWSATFSPDGKKIATASFDETAILWDTSSGKELAVLTGHRGSLHYIAFSPDGNRLVTTSLGGKANSEGEVAKLWSSDGQSSVVLHGHQGEVRHAAFSPDGKWLISASSDKTTRVWNVLTGQQPSVISNINNGATFNRDGTRIFTEHSNGDTGYLWKNDGQQLAILKGNDAVFSNDSGKILVYDNRYCESDNCYYDYDAFYLYDAKDGKELAKLKSEKRRVFMALSYDKNGQRLIELRDAAKNIRVFNVKFSPKGKFIVAISYLNVRIWDSSTGQELAILPLFIDVTGRYHPFPCMNWTRLALVGKNNCVTFSPDERLIAVADGDNTVGIWDTSNGQKLSTLVVVDINRSLRYEYESIWSIAFSSDGTRIITASNSETHNARLWDIATGKELLTFSGHEDPIEDVAFSPDGKLVLTGSRDGTARVWDAKTAKKIAVLGGHDGFVRQVSFSENGEKISTISVVNASSTIKFKRRRIFDAKTFKLLTLDPSLILNQHRNEIQAVLHGYGQEYEKMASGYHVDETALTTSNGAMLMPAFGNNGTTLYWLPIFSGLDSLMSYTRKFLSRHEWTCEERRRFFLEVSRCPEQKLQEGQSPEHATDLRFAEVGDLEKQYIVALSYSEGIGVVKNVEEGNKWLRKAAEQGHAPAQAGLAGFYYQGKGVPQNYKESAKWALKAAEQGQAGAQGLLCSMLVMYQTYGIGQNDQEAFKWCSQAAMEVASRNALSLGILYRDGRGVKQNLKEAAKWFQRFLQSGYDSKQPVAWLHHLVEIISVSPNSQAERLGLKVGDSFTHYDGHPVFNTNFFVSEHDAEPMTSLPKELKVLRGSQELVFQIPHGKLGIELKDVDK